MRTVIRKETSYEGGGAVLRKDGEQWKGVDIKDKNARKTQGVIDLRASDGAWNKIGVYS